MANSKMGLLGIKLGMTQIYVDDNVVPCTIVQLGPCRVLQAKTTDGKDGYSALQLGFGSQKEQRITKAEKGHFAKTSSGVSRWVSEIRVTAAEIEKYAPGTDILVTDVFAAGDVADVIGDRKGRGFQGVMKKYHFKGFIRSHGSHEYFRHGGSIGTRLTPGMTLKGKKMPGRRNGQVTVQNIDVVRVEAERGLIFLRGGAPGPNGGRVKVRLAVKGSK